MLGFWRAKEKPSPAPTHEAVAPAPDPRVMDPKEIAMHVVEAMRDGPRFWLTRDMESVAKAWWTENRVEPIQLCYLREAMQAMPGVRYAKINLRGAQFGPIRRALESRGMRTEKQFVYEIIPVRSQAQLQPQASPSSVPGPAQVHPGPPQAGTLQNWMDLGGNRSKTRAA